MFLQKTRANFTKIKFLIKQEQKKKYYTLKRPKQTLGKIYNIYENHIIAILKLINEEYLLLYSEVTFKNKNPTFSQDPEEQSTHLEQASIWPMAHSHLSERDAGFYYLPFLHSLLSAN